MLPARVYSVLQRIPLVLLVIHLFFLVMSPNKAEIKYTVDCCVFLIFVWTSLFLRFLYPFCPISLVDYLPLRSIEGFPGEESLATVSSQVLKVNCWVVFWPIFDFCSNDLLGATTTVPEPQYPKFLAE